ncbi:Uncharacterised protein [Vibrio cholerae]|nr:Uncharacterised protein [Vibrio cholerae]
MTHSAHLCLFVLLMTMNSVSSRRRFNRCGKAKSWQNRNSINWLIMTASQASPIAVCCCKN